MRLLTLFVSAHAETIIRYLLSDHVDPRLSMSAVLATRMDHEKLESLLQESKKAFVLVLPTDEGWSQHPELYNTVNDDSATANRFRADLMFAAGGEIDEVGGFDALMSYAEQNDGVVDTAYGTPMKIEEDGRVCLAEYDENWKLRTTHCAQLILPPLILNDGSLYMTDHIILPDQLWSEVSEYQSSAAVAS